VSIGFTAIQVLVIALAISAAILPPAVPASSPHPVATYAEALKRVAALKARDDASIAYGTVFLGQGSKVATAVVIVHGYTNNPKQFAKIAADYHAAGYNVLVPRLPGHGKRDLMTDALSQATAPAYVRTIDDSIDIARGLGDHVQVVGLSGGGTMALWAAYNRDEVERVVAIAPLMLPFSVPDAVVKPITVAARLIPDIHIPWDPINPNAENIPPHRYPRLSIRSMAALLDLSFHISETKPQRKTRLAEVVLVNNESDFAVDMSYSTSIVKSHFSPLASRTQIVTMPVREGFAHDLIDPEGVNAANIGKIYARLYPVLGIPAKP
jgi:carboxylesterase